MMEYNVTNSFLYFIFFLKWIIKSNAAYKVKYNLKWDKQRDIQLNQFKGLSWKS